MHRCSHAHGRRRGLARTGARRECAPRGGFTHALLWGETTGPFESIEYPFREHGDAVSGENDDQPWNAAPPLSGAETRVEVCLAEARYVERRVPFLDMPGRVRRAKAMACAGDQRERTPVDDGPMFRYLQWIREEGEERMVPPDLMIRTIYLVELVCPPDRSVVLAEEGLRGRLEDDPSNAVDNARVSGRWCVGPADLIRVKHIEYDLDDRRHVPVPAKYWAAPNCDSG